MLAMFQKYRICLTTSALMWRGWRQTAHMMARRVCDAVTETSPDRNGHHSTAGDVGCD